MADNKYPQGLKGFQRRDNAPDFVLGQLIIEPRVLFDWFKTEEGKASLTDYNGTKQAKFSILKGKNGNFLNFQVDNYEKGQNQQKTQPKSQQGANSGGNTENDLPF